MSTRCLLRKTACGLLMVMCASCGKGERDFVDVGASLTPVGYCTAAWGDYDNDGDFDLLVSGHRSSSVVPFVVCKLYRNDSGFAEVTSAILPPVIYCDAAWADIDHDGHVDMAISGSSDAGIFRNNGDSSFSEVSNPVPAMEFCALGWGDYDNDGDVDLVVAGSYMDGAEFKIETKLFANNGAVFAEIASAGFEGVDLSSVAWGDYDNDGDLDLVIAGRGGVVPQIAKIYENDGNGGFAEFASSLPAVNAASVAWGDYDNDGDLDLVIAGSGIVDTKVFENTPGGLAENLNANIVGVNYCSVAWGDYDNDGDLDLALAGELNSGTGRTARVYRNEGAGSFADICAGIVGVDNCTVRWGDYDNDGDLDLLVSGQTASGDSYHTAIYRNECGVANSAPNAPTGLSEVVNVSDVTFNWSAATDAETPSPGLTYNLKVRAESGGDDDIMPCMSDPVTGKRRIPAMGNVQHNTSWTLKSLASGTYYWSVQSVDTGFMGSAWAPEGSFVIP